ncbi:MAG: SGNH/GDSL hydrolase family protein [Clostridia bacterium]|nr:SGNH/GDSL hydrolase family protein [Clostridia bacterium]
MIFFLVAILSCATLVACCDDNSGGETPPSFDDHKIKFDDDWKNYALSNILKLQNFENNLPNNPEDVPVTPPVKPVDPTIEKVDFSTMTMVCFGDSLTFGSDPIGSGIALEKPYPTLVKELLGLYEVHNCGLFGSTLAYVSMTTFPMSVLYEGLPTPCDIMAVWGGSNDYLATNIPLGTPTDTERNTVFGALNFLVHELTKAYPDAYIFFITPFQFPGCNKINEMGFTLEDVATAINVVGQIHGIDVLNLFELEEILYDLTTDQSDGKHPSQEFTTNVTAPLIAQFIVENYEKPLNNQTKKKNSVPCCVTTLYCLV